MCRMEKKRVVDFMFQLDKEDVEILKSQTTVEVNIRRLANARIVLFFFEIHIPQYSE